MKRLAAKAPLKSGILKVARACSSSVVRVVPLSSLAAVGNSEVSCKLHADVTSSQKAKSEDVDRKRPGFSVTSDGEIKRRSKKRGPKARHRTARHSRRAERALNSSHKAL